MKGNIILIFSVLWGIFFTFKNIKENRSYLINREMKEILAGVTCNNHSCKYIGLCGTVLNPLKCLGRSPRDRCIACIAGVREYSTCSGFLLPPGHWCEEYTTSCDKGIEGYCEPVGIDPETGQLMLICIGAVGEEYQTCGDTRYCQNKP
ncbi:MAG: hypothetical protein NC926_07120 [Candidatus Omnitrophica bacterium]|nr:hypothetical protein [Candidatus Omnitrophota bacterium]